MEPSRQESWSGFTLSYPGIKPMSLCLLRWQADPSHRAKWTGSLSYVSQAASIWLQMCLYSGSLAACAFDLCRTAAAAAKSCQSCLTLCNPIDGSPPGSAVPGILQARALEWVATSFSNAWKWKVKVKSLSHVWLFVTPWTAAYQAPPSMGFSRQDYWSGLPLPSPWMAWEGLFLLSCSWFF